MLSLQVLQLTFLIITLAGYQVAADKKGKPAAAKKPAGKLTYDERIDRWLNSTYFLTQKSGCISPIETTLDEGPRIGFYSSCDPLVDKGEKPVDESLNPVPRKCCSAKNNNLKPPKPIPEHEQGRITNMFYGMQKHGECVMATIKAHAAFLCKCLPADASCDGTLVTTCCSSELSCNPITKTCRKPCAPKGTSCLHNGEFDVKCCSGDCKKDMLGGGECA